MFSNQIFNDPKALLSDIGITSECSITYSLRHDIQPLIVSIEIQNGSQFKNINFGLIELPCKDFYNKIITLTQKWFEQNFPETDIPQHDEHYFIGFKHKNCFNQNEPRSLNIDDSANGDTLKLANFDEKFFRHVVSRGHSTMNDMDSGRDITHDVACYAERKTIHWIENKDILNYEEVFTDKGQMWFVFWLSQACMIVEGTVILQQMLYYSNEYIRIKFRDQAFTLCDGVTIWIDKLPIGTTMVFPISSV